MSVSARDRKVVIYGELARMRALTDKYNTTARLKDGKIQLFSKKRGAWVDAPSETQA